MTDAELTKFSGEHLLHELEMFEWAAGAESYLDGRLHDAVVESWVAHLRNLMLFFCHSRSDTDDVIAADFLDNPADWSQSESATLKAARERANKELSHLTEKRKYVGDPAKPWEVDALGAEIASMAAAFGAKASEKKLHAKVREFLKAPAKKVVAVMGGSQASNVTSRVIGTSSAGTGSTRKF